jgi:pyruvate dehydrogenase E1 component
MVPQAVAAGLQLKEKGVFANIFNVTGAGPLYREVQNSLRGVISGGKQHGHLLDELVPAAEHKVPVVTVVDGHPHTLAWIGAALNAPTCPLGVVGFGQSGTVSDLYQEYKVDAGNIQAACHQALNR